MKIFYIFSLFILGLYKFSLVNSFQEWWEDSKVVELTNANFDEIVGKDKYVVLKFYTRWCGYCRLMAPEYDKLFDLYKEKRSDVIIARLEGSLNEQISLRYGIFNFPMVVLFIPNDSQIKTLFQGQRNVPSFEQWIESNAPPLENKMLEVKIEEKKFDETKLDDNLIIQKANKTEVTDDIEFVKREIVSLKKKVEMLENELINLKNNSTNTSSLTANQIRIPTAYEIFIIIGIGTIIIAALLTLKKLFSNKRINLGTQNSAHAKV